MEQRLNELEKRIYELERHLSKLAFHTGTHIGELEKKVTAVTATSSVSVEKLRDLIAAAFNDV